LRLDKRYKYSHSHHSESFLILSSAHSPTPRDHQRHIPSDSTSHVQLPTLTMHSFITAAALVASASVCLAAPTRLVGRSTFKIEQVAVGKVFKSGPVAMMKTYNKYAKVGAVAPSAVVAAAAAAQSGEVSATPEQYDESYLCPVTVGSQTLNLDFDTGSADL